MHILEDSYARRHAIELPRELTTARIDKSAIEALGAVNARTSLCIPWRMEEDVLVLLLPEDCAEVEWDSLIKLATQQISEQRHIRKLVFRSSGLDTEMHRKTLDFLYRRAESNISCVNMFEFVCPMRWQALRPTDDPRKRHCVNCKRDVHLVANEQEFENRSQRGDCVAYAPLASTEEQNRPMMLGRVLPPEELARELRLRDAATRSNYGAISLEDYLASVGDHGDAEAGEDPRS